jgi:hypothetical protein
VLVTVVKTVTVCPEYELEVELAAASELTLEPVTDVDATSLLQLTVTMPAPPTVIVVLRLFTEAMKSPPVVDQDVNT